MALGGGVDDRIALIGAWPSWSVRIPLARLLDGYQQLDPAAPTVVYCAGGYRSSVGASLLRAKGFSRVADLQGGYDAWAAAGLPVDHGAVAP